MGVALRFPPRLVLVCGFLCVVSVGVFFLSSWSSCRVLDRVLPLATSDVLPLVGVFESLSWYTVGKKLEALAVKIKNSFTTEIFIILNILLFEPHHEKTCLWGF